MRAFTPDALETYKKRMQEWERDGKIRTHLIEDAPLRRSKYRNVRTQVEGIWFASKREAKRYEDLRLMEKSGEITELRRQVPFELVVNGLKVCKYYADFTYLENGELVVNDAKGMKTKVYALKKKLMFACFRIEILET